LIKKCLDQFTDGISSVAVSPDGQNALIACGGYWKGREYMRGTDYALRIWDLETDREVTSKLLSGSGEKEIPRLQGHTDEVYCVTYSADGQRAASCGRDQIVRVWDVKTGKELRSLRGLEGTVYGVAFSPDGSQVLSGGSDRTLRLWHVNLGTQVHCFRGHTDFVWAVAFSKDGKYAVSGSGLGLDAKRLSHGVPAFTEGTKDYTVRMWDIQAKTERHCFKGHTQVVNTVTFTPDGRRIVSGSQDGTVRVWDAATGQQLISFTGHQGSVMKLAAFPDGRHVVSGGYDKTLRIWNLADIDRHVELQPR
jgi:WD40 repeat protein